MIQAPTTTSQYIVNRPAAPQVPQGDQEYTRLLKHREDLLSELAKITREKDSVNNMNDLLIQKLMSFGQSMFSLISDIHLSSSGMMV